MFACFFGEEERKTSVRKSCCVQRFLCVKASVCESVCAKASVWKGVCVETRLCVNAALCKSIFELCIKRRCVKASASKSFFA